MGLMRFSITPPDRLAPEAVDQAYLSGYDRIAWKSRVEYADGLVTFQRPVSDSGNLHIPWPVEGHGQVVLSTASLMEERSRPYQLPLELARGRLGQIRDRLAEWRSQGLTIGDEVTEPLGRAMAHFGRAAASQETPAESARAAEASLAAAMEAGDRLAACYAEQALAIRRRAGEKLPTFLAADLGISLLDDYAGRLFLQTFNVGRVPLSWREVEATEGSYTWEIADRQIAWCRAHGLKVCAGPLLQLDQRGIPDWLYLWEGDFDNVQSFATAYVKAVIARYRDKVDMWICAGRFNTSDVLSLSEEEVLRLAVQTIELTRAEAPGAPVVISFDQPWAEYMTRREVDFPPLHFADALVRGNVGLTGLALEINMGYSPNGTLTRDPLDFSRQLDIWGSLGLPLVVAVTAPSDTIDDPLAHRDTKILPGPWSLKSQQAWVGRFIPILLSKPFVHGIIWNQYRDSEPHDFPHGGLLDLNRHPKPAMRILASLRQAHLK